MCQNVWIRRFLYVCSPKQLIDYITDLCVGLLLAWINWGFAVCLSVDNMRPNLDILLTTALFAGFRPLRTFSLLDPIQKHSGHRTCNLGTDNKSHLLPKEAEKLLCHYNISIILSYTGEELILFTHKEVIPSYRTMKSELFTIFTPKFQTHHTTESSTFLIKKSV